MNLTLSIKIDVVRSFSDTEASLRTPFGGKLGYIARISVLSAFCCNAKAYNNSHSLQMTRKASHSS